MNELNGTSTLVHLSGLLNFKEKSSVTNPYTPDLLSVGLVDPEEFEVTRV